MYKVPAAHKSYCTVVGDYINIMKPTFDFNFGLYQAFKQHKCTQKHENK